VSASRSALIVHDTQNDFCLPGGKVYDRGAKRPEMIVKLIREVAALLAAARQSGVTVVYIRNTHLVGAKDVSASHLERLKSMGLGGTAGDISCIIGSWGYQVVDALSPFDDDIIVDKNSYNIFESSMIDKVLRAQDIERVILTGISTYSGILGTAFGLMDHGYHFVIPRECVTGYDADLHEAALKILAPYSVGVAELIEAWKGER
jgi:nicotinamidase-related amidase